MFMSKGKTIIIRKNTNATITYIYNFLCDSLINCMECLKCCSKDDALDDYDVLTIHSKHINNLPHYCTKINTCARSIENNNVADNNNTNTCNNNASNNNVINNNVDNNNASNNNVINNNVINNNVDNIDNELGNNNNLIDKNNMHNDDVICDVYNLSIIMMEMENNLNVPNDDDYESEYDIIQETDKIKKN